MSKGLWEIVSGESFFVRADSEDEALALFFVSQGHMEKADYPEFDIRSEELDTVEYNGADTIATYVHEL